MVGWGTSRTRVRERRLRTGKDARFDRIGVDRPQGPLAGSRGSDPQDSVAHELMIHDGDIFPENEGDPHEGTSRDDAGGHRIVVEFSLFGRSPLDPPARQGPEEE